MSILQVSMYRVICDGCGACAQDPGEFYAWADKDQAEDEATGSDWLVPGDGRHWCLDCTVLDGETEDMVPTAAALAASARRATGAAVPA